MNNIRLVTKSLKDPYKQAFQGYDAIILKERMMKND